jgi:hypothetical protein
LTSTMQPMMNMMTSLYMGLLCCRHFINIIFHKFYIRRYNQCKL